jgi:hypothetical protein
MRDVDIRLTLLNDLGQRFQGDRIVNEMGLCLGATRVDVAVINGSLHGYEIKSDRDKLNRLTTQIELYDKVLDYSTIVCGPRYVDRMAALLPSWWGIFEARDDGDMRVLSRRRTARKNPTCDRLAVAQLLWRDEAAALLVKRGEAVRSRETRWELWDRLAEWPVRELKLHVRTQLKVRRGWSAD